MKKPAYAPEGKLFGAKKPTVSSMLAKLLVEARWLIYAALAVYLVLILASFSKVDPGWSHATPVESIVNLGGRVGAFLSDLMLYVFGFSAWWWCIFLARSVQVEYRKLFNADAEGDEHSYDSLIAAIGFVFLFAGSMGIEFLRMHTLRAELPKDPGGVLGEIIGRSAQGAIGFTSSTLLFLLFMVIGASLYFRFSWLTVAERVGELIEVIFSRLYNSVSAYIDRRMGERAATERKVVVEKERQRIEVEAPVKIEPQFGPIPQASLLDEDGIPELTELVEQPEKIEKIEKIKIEPVLKAVPKSTERERLGNTFAVAGAGALPQLSLLDKPQAVQESVSEDTIQYTSRLIEKKLADFSVSVKVVSASPGPVITRYEIDPATGVKGSQIVNLARDLARALTITSLRVVETIPGRNYMGLELPNPRRQMVRLTEILGSKAYAESASPLTVALGKDIAGSPVIADLAKMPHLLVAGTTGSGKSVGINATILSLLFKSDPSHVRLILIDPKMLEMSVYEGIPHLLAPVVTDMQQAGHALNWAVAEMERRYKLMSKLGVRNLAGYNQKIADAAGREEKIGNPFSLTPDAPEPLEHLPNIVIIIDELADLMMAVGKKVEELIARIAQKARAAGIHLILATQRPSVDVITGLIKANVPTRIAFQVSSKIDSRTILDQMGAETLLGMGDMLYLPPGTGLPLRVHGAYVSDDEVLRVAEFLRGQGEPSYIEGILDGASSSESEGGGASGAGAGSFGESDAMYDQAVSIVLKNKKASISLVQRHLRIGYNRAARLLEQMEQNGLVSAMGTNGNRELLVQNGLTE